jgi:hypothetical protein
VQSAIGSYYRQLLEVHVALVVCSPQQQWLQKGMLPRSTMNAKGARQHRVTPAATIGFQRCHTAVLKLAAEAQQGVLHGRVMRTAGAKQHTVPLAAQPAFKRACCYGGVQSAAGHAALQYDECQGR